MAEATEILTYQTQAGHSYWGINAPGVGSSRQFTIVVLAGQALYVATYLTRSGFDQAIARLCESTDVLNDLGTQTVGKRRHEIPFDSIDRLEMFPFAYELKVRYTVDNAVRWVTLRTPPLDFYGELFERLRQRVAAGQEVVDQPASAVRVAGGPLIGMLVTIAVGGGLHYMAEEIAAGKDFDQFGQGKVQLIAMLASWLAGTLGPAGVVIVASLAFAGLFAWLVRRVNDRPQRSVVDVRPY
jgi:hypothetical protein